MKKTIFALLTVATLVSCKKSETTTVEQSTDTSTSAPVDSGRVVGDSATVSTDTTGTSNTLSDQDKKFADAAAMGGMMEVMMGKLAATNAANAAVKSLGEMMVNDHSKANDELKSWASSVKYTLPAGLDAEKQKKYDDLKAKKGADFDKAYADLMVSDHKKDIEEFKKEAADGTETSLKSFANGKVPTLEHHLMEAEKAKAAVK